MTGGSISPTGARESCLAIDDRGRAETLATIDAIPFSFDFLPDGRMALLAGTTLSIRRPDGSFARHADLVSLSPKPWNEIVADAAGRLYVNTIGFDFPGGEFRPGLVASVGTDGGVRLEAEDVAFPNGMAVDARGGQRSSSPESYASRLTAFAIGTDGALGERRAFAELPGFHPDGISFDAEGAVWFADVPGRCCVRVLPDGTIAGRIDVDRGCFACMLGGEDGRTLFIVAADWQGPQAIGPHGADRPGAGRAGARAACRPALRIRRDRSPRVRRDCRLGRGDRAR